MEFSITLAGVFAWVISFVVMNSVFALSLWIYLPIEKSPFADGAADGIKKCMLFSLAMGVIAFGLMFLSVLGALIMLVVFFVGMRRFFDCGILDTFIIGAIQFGVWVSISWILSKIG
ncbi:MAG: hypothetical protein HOH86_05390 [Verrucomicrobiales bacterium]|jgi:hypothetical protein|nr:hypothetical protein [Verrucomicrobiales bacterium]